MTDEVQRCGFIAVVGRPNVGKSTLVNRLVGGKVSIVSPKAQTTRHVIRGVLTRGAVQYVFVDTPGFQTRHGSALNRLMNRSVTTTLQDVDLVLCVVEAGGITDADREVFRLLPDGRPTILLLNKIDRLADKKVLLPRIAQAAEERGFAEIIPISAVKGRGCEDLLRTVSDYLPEAGHLFEADAITDRSERFLAAEFIREKLFNRLGDELPYGLTVEVERFEVEGGLRRIAAAIIVDRESHKPIIIGKGGEALKAVASAAREEMERLFDGKVFLEVWVKVRGGWADDERALRSLGYE